MPSDSYYKLENRIEEAIDALHDGWCKNCTKAARAYDVPIRQLQRRWNGSNFKSTRHSTNKALMEEQEEAIREYIDRCDRFNMCARPKMILGAASYLIRSEDRVMVYLDLVYRDTRNENNQDEEEKNNRKTNLASI